MKTTIGIALILSLSSFAWAGVDEDDTGIEAEGMISESDGALASAKAQQKQLEQTTRDEKRGSVKAKQAILEANQRQKDAEIAMQKTEAEIAVVQAKIQKSTNERKAAESLANQAVKKYLKLEAVLKAYKTQNSKLQAQISEQNAKLAATNEKAARVQSEINARKATLANQKRVLQQKPARATAASISAGPVTH